VQVVVAKEGERAATIGTLGDPLALLYRWKRPLGQPRANPQGCASSGRFVQRKHTRIGTPLPNMNLPYGEIIAPQGNVVTIVTEPSGLSKIVWNVLDTSETFHNLPVHSDTFHIWLGSF
jgi:hypothetical protein